VLWRKLKGEEWYYFQTPGIIDGPISSLSVDSTNALWIGNDVCINIQHANLTMERIGITVILYCFSLSTNDIIDRLRTGTHLLKHLRGEHRLWSSRFRLDRLFYPRCLAFIVSWSGTMSLSFLIRGLIPSSLMRHLYVFVSTTEIEFQVLLWTPLVALAFFCRKLDSRYQVCCKLF